jgi:putative ABC transport system substrate-binding protein
MMLLSEPGAHMRRREFLRALGSAAAAMSPVAAAAQQLAMPAIGFLGPSSPQLFAERLDAFRRGLGDIGFHEGRNVRIEYRWAGGNLNRLPALAADLIRGSVSAMVSAGLAAALAAKATTTAIPIVFFIGEDPVGLGLVANLSRPGGNLTGVTTLNTEVGPKRLELVRELIPSAKSVALLLNPTGPNVDSLEKQMQAAARTLGLGLLVLHAGNERDLDHAVARGAREANALVITTDAFFISRIKRIARLTVEHPVPAIFQYRDFVAEGGLMSYGGNFLDSFRQLGAYAGRILKGEKPADLPVQQATKVELIINLKTAKALGLTVPLTLLGRADEVVE